MPGSSIRSSDRSSRIGLRPLVVRSIVPQGADIVAVELEDPAGAPLDPWEPGAHIDLQLVTRQLRQYSLCGDPADLGRYRIAVLRSELSRGASSYVHGFLRVGSRVHVRPPRNHFPLVPAEGYLLLAAGIGITPLLPMAAELQRRRASWSLDYAVRNSARMPFAEELRAWGSAVTVHARDASGRLDLEGRLRAPRPGIAVYCCGPERFTEAVAATMGDWPPGSLHVERFTPKPRAVRPNAPFSVLAARSQVRVEVPPEQSMLHALESQGLPVGGSCLSGVCGACAVTVLAGSPDHRDSLTADESSTTLYPCVSRSLSPELVVDL